MPISAIDLFCGVGGLTHGLQLAGVPVVAGFDVENSCKYAYEKNNTAKFVLKDITQLTGNELEGYYPPNTTVKILVGCAPCQPFSTYSLRYNKHGRKDEKWKLLYYFSNLIKEVQPEVVSMENVPQLSHEKVLFRFFGGTTSFKVLFNMGDSKLRRLWRSSKSKKIGTTSIKIRKDKVD